jgi:hypothetical protein
VAARSGEDPEREIVARLVGGEQFVRVLEQRVRARHDVHVHPFDRRAA